MKSEILSTDVDNLFIDETTAQENISFTTEFSDGIENRYKEIEALLSRHKERTGLDISCCSLRDEHLCAER